MCAPRVSWRRVLLLGVFVCVFVCAYVYASAAAAAAVAAAAFAVATNAAAGAAAPAPPMITLLYIITIIHQYTRVYTYIQIK